MGGEYGTGAESSWQVSSDIVSKSSKNIGAWVVGKKEQWHPSK